MLPCIAAQRKYRRGALILVNLAKVHAGCDRQTKTGPPRPRGGPVSAPTRSEDEIIRAQHIGHRIQQHYHHFDGRTARHHAIGIDVQDGIGTVLFGPDGKAAGPSLRPVTVPIAARSITSTPGWKSVMISNGGPLSWPPPSS